VLPLRCVATPVVLLLTQVCVNFVGDRAFSYSEWGDGRLGLSQFNYELHRRKRKAVLFRPLLSVCDPDYNFSGGGCPAPVGRYLMWLVH